VDKSGICASASTITSQLTDPPRHRLPRHQGTSSTPLLHHHQMLARTMRPSPAPLTSSLHELFPYEARRVEIHFGGMNYGWKQGRRGSWYDIIIYTVNDSAATRLPGPQRQQHRLFVERHTPLKYLRANPLLFSKTRHASQSHGLRMYGRSCHDNVNLDVRWWWWVNQLLYIVLVLHLLSSNSFFFSGRMIMLE
jgi:hypothetical protein